MVVITKKRFTDLLEHIVHENPHIESSAIITRGGTMIETDFHAPSQDTSLMDTCIALISMSQHILSACQLGEVITVRICGEKKDVVLDALNEHGLLLSILTKEQ
jgi:predicted regulator of Ras-like GTPase activity (Roadblock/LC7/MglB family)